MCSYQHSSTISDGQLFKGCLAGGGEAIRHLLMACLNSKNGDQQRHNRVHCMQLQDCYVVGPFDMLIHLLLPAPLTQRTRLNVSSINALVCMFQHFFYPYAPFLNLLVMFFFQSVSIYMDTQDNRCVYRLKKINAKCGFFLLSMHDAQQYSTDESIES